MDVVLCDELVQEILRRLPASAAPSVSLVSKRWLSLLRSSTASLSLRIPPHLTASAAAGVTAADGRADGPSVSSILAQYPFLAELTIISTHEDEEGEEVSGADALLLAIAASACSRRLSHLRFLPASQVSPSALVSSAAAFSRLISLQISFLLPLSLRWLSCLPTLRSLSLFRSRPRRSSALAGCRAEGPPDDEDDGDADRFAVVMLSLESLSLSGIGAGDRGLAWLWRRCGRLRWLQLRACDGTGDDPSSPAFPTCLPDLLGLELRTCRAIADRVLLHAADRCRVLTSLLLYDGGSRDALHHFIHRRGAALRTLDLRLPLDLHNDHLFAIAADDQGRGVSGPSELAALRLHSCCLVTGDGLRSLARSPAGAAIKDLALVNCDVVEREPGLLTFLSQSMQRLQRLDLSHNETLTDKEVGAMLASCKNLAEIRLRGCRALKGAFLNSLLKHCSQQVEVVDVSRCPDISSNAIEIFVMNASKLNWLMVEERKLTEAANILVSQKAIKIS